MKNRTSLFFFNDTATTEIYTLSLHDALPISIPNFVRARTTSQMNACINNLRQIDGAVQQRSLENTQAVTASVDFTYIGSYLKSSVLCPSAGAAATFATSYTITTVSNKPSCQI